MNQECVNQIPVYFGGGNVDMPNRCIAIYSDGSEEIPDVESDQEEADDRL